VKIKGELADSESPGWTGPEAYVSALARRRTFRRSRERGLDRRTQTDQSHFLLSTLPFLALFAALAVMTVGIALAAFPGWWPDQHARPSAARELGTAEKGWFEEAQREFK
jgi:hypothetical protein